MKIQETKDRYTLTSCKARTIVSVVVPATIGDSVYLIAMETANKTPTFSSPYSQHFNNTTG